MPATPTHLVSDMKIPFLTPKNHDLARLIAAIASNGSDDIDTMAHFMEQEMWDALAPYLEPESFDRGYLLTTQGAYDRTLYFIESGTVRVHFTDAQRQIHIANLGPGSVVGEASFFSHFERSATVQAVMPCQVWSLTPERFARLSKEKPTVALTLAMALGATVSVRLLNLSKRLSQSPGQV